MTFTWEDYEQSIARIFYQDTETAIGTGFLVAPGYVLTCAHVVLQAVGIDFDKQKSASYKEVVKELVFLDFPILADGDKIKAKVVAWLPYSVSRGDVAGLKLLKAEPSESKPIPLVQVSLSDIENDEHSVYGFSNENGERSDAYIPKIRTAGGRFQFYKAGNPNDETIQAGFSGAPVWNEQRTCVIGMIATALVSRDEQRSKAYAIPKKELDGVLKKLSVYSLCDLIENHLQQLSNDNQQKLSSAIATAFRLCDSGSVWGEKKMLQSRLLSLSQLGNRGWDNVDRLTQFAIFLATMDAVSGSMYQQIKNWVEYRGFYFDSLQSRAILEKRERNVSSADSSEHLVVEVRPDEKDKEKVWISMWEISDRHTYNPQEPLPYLLQEHTLPYADLPDFVETCLEEKSTLNEPMVHFFVPRAWLDRDFDSSKTLSDLTLGSQYKVVMRTDLNQSPTGKKYFRRWQDKWQHIEAKSQHTARETFVWVDTTKNAELLGLKTAEMAILENLSAEQVESVFEFIARKTALPVALWVRHSKLCHEVDRILDRTVAELPQRIYEERLDALREDDNHCLGGHLSLVWEDAKIVPPTMDLQFDQEAC
ncbi:MAG: trypsin-like peptidase domain-containing protein [Cyanophyceae cyanobacterium]